MTDRQLETDRLRLMPPSLEDLPIMLAVLQSNKEHLAPFLPWLPHVLSEEQLKQSIVEAMDSFEKFEGEQRYSLFNKENGVLVGVIGLIVRDQSVPYFEIGYWLAQDYVGQGYISEAVLALEHYAFTELKAQRIEIKAAQTNLKSRAVPERNGYQLEGVLQKARRLPSGVLDNTVIYAKTRPTRHVVIEDLIVKSSR